VKLYTNNMASIQSDAHLNKLGMAGDYNKNSAPQKVALTHTFPLLERAVLSICLKGNFSPEHTFTVADYGSSHGGNSLQPITNIIEAVRKHSSPKQAIAVYHTDLPQNDYNALFGTLHENEESYMKYSLDEAPVLSYATATPFFQQILPASSVHFGFSASAAHWLSCFPSEEAQYLYTVAAPEPIRAVWREQAAVDWNKFLAARSKELAPGGVLVLANLFMEDNGDYTTKELGDVMDNIVSEMLKNDMVDAKAARRFSHPSYFRTQAEYTSPVSQHNMTLRASFSRHIQNPLYHEHKATGDWVAFGKAMAAWAKQWAHVALLRVISHLDAEGQKNASAFFYRRVEEEVAARPHDHQTLMVMLYLMIEKNVSSSTPQS